MKLSLQPELVEKLVWVQVILICKIFIPCSAFDTLLCQNWLFSPPNHETLRRNLMEFKFQTMSTNINKKVFFSQLAVGKLFYVEHQQEVQY
jgi:hypothetical protein